MLSLSSAHSEDLKSTENAPGIHVQFRKNKKPNSEPRSTLADSLRASSTKHNLKEETIFAPDLHLDPNMRKSVKSNISENYIQDSNIDAASSFIRDYREESGQTLKEEPIFDAAIADRQTVSHLTELNQDEQIKANKDSSMIITSTSEEAPQAGEFDPVVFIKTLPPYASLPLAYRQCPLLPPKEPGVPEYTLVLDLDETLVHCSMNVNHAADLVFSVRFDDERYTIYASIRPFLFYLLKRIAPYYEIIVFTASQPCYANRLLDIIDSETHYISKRLYRNHCLQINGNYVKDLNRLNRDLSKTVIVDNSVNCFGYNIENGIPIMSWYDDRSDHELYNLSTVLLSFLRVPDVRPAIESLFHLKEMLDEIEIEPLCVCFKHFINMQLRESPTL